MGLGRRKVSLSDPSRWVFNRMAQVYDARPPYPDSLIAHVASLAPGPRVLDLGAGIGHLALPLARAGLQVTAVEPAREMLARLAQASAPVQAVHAQAESLPFEAHSFDLALIADALHFLDVERVGRQLARVLARDGALGVVQVEPAPSPYMDALVALMRQAAPRRPRATGNGLAQLAAIVGTKLEPVLELEDHCALSHGELIRLLDSISFIGPAMNEERRERFHARVLKLGAPIWSRRLTLYAGRRRAR